jgi:hypothetical protein
VSFVFAIAGCCQEPALPAFRSALDEVQHGQGGCLLGRTPPAPDARRNPYDHAEKPDEAKQDRATESLDDLPHLAVPLCKRVLPPISGAMKNFHRKASTQNDQKAARQGSARSQKAPKRQSLAFCVLLEKFDDVADG